MKILLLGEYSNVHHTLAEGLRVLGHEVTVASDGDGWKGYDRDIDLTRRSHGVVNTIRYWLEGQKQFSKFKGYDVVQLINPVFLNLKAERMMPYYRQLKRNNASIFMGAYGMDHFFVKACLDYKTFRYSDFAIGNSYRDYAENQVWIRDWLNGSKGELNKRIADDCNGIVAGLYEYYASYLPYYSEKLTFIPFPIKPHPAVEKEYKHTPDKVRFFIGIQKRRNTYKGTDIMLRALERVHEEMPSLCEIVKVESVPFKVYCEMMEGSDVILDQLYSYTPAMNALEAMSKGLIVVGGGEPENYEILNETELRPIVNVWPSEENVYDALRQLVLERHKVPLLSKESRLYIERHHHYIKVARQYLDFWQSRM